MDNRGISAIVATVLIILITVAAVAILWGVILPMLNEVDISNEKVISIDTSGGYTLYDETQKIACVQVKRESSLALEGLRVLFNIEGNSFYSLIAKGDVPELNQKKTYCFSLSNFGRPSSVTVVALPEDKSVAVTSKVSVNELNVQALGSIVGDEGSPSQLRYLDGDSGILTGCAVLNVSGKTYRLANDVTTTGTCFNITANNIVLDGNGFKIIGGEVENTQGVYAKERNNLTIKNFKNITLFGSSMGTGSNIDQSGIIFEGTSNSLIKNINLYSNGYFGIYMRSGYNNTLDGITSGLHEETEIRLSQSSYNFLNNITITPSLDLGYDGIQVMTYSNNNLLENINVTSKGRGINIVDSGFNNLTNITLNQNYYGLYLFSSHNNSLKNINASSTNYIGVYFAGSSNNSLLDVVSTFNQGYGIQLLIGSSNNKFLNNSFCGNTNLCNSGGGINLGNNKCSGTLCGFACTVC